MTDLASVKAETTIEELKTMAAAEKWGFAGIYGLPAHNPMLRELMGDNPKSFLGGAVGFPSGGVSTETKVFETVKNIEAGCGEIDMVVNIAWLKAGMLREFEADIRAVVEAADGLVVKTILEVHHLSADEIGTASSIAAGCGVSFIKTATGWAESGANRENIGIIKDAIAGTSCEIKAAGGIRTLESVREMLDLGVRRFGCGTETALKIIDEIEK